MPLQTLPDPVPRVRHLSAECRAWVDDPKRTTEESDAFKEASDHLRAGRWGPVRLASSLLFEGVFYAHTSTGHRIIVRFGMKPPLPAVFFLGVEG